MKRETSFQKYTRKRKSCPSWFHSVGWMLLSGCNNHSFGGIFYNLLRFASCLNNMASPGSHSVCCSWDNTLYQQEDIIEAGHKTSSGWLPSFSLLRVLPWGCWGVLIRTLEILIASVSVAGWLERLRRGHISGLLVVHNKPFPLFSADFKSSHQHITQSGKSMLMTDYLAIATLWRESANEALSSFIWLAS